MYCIGTIYFHASDLTVTGRPCACYKFSIIVWYCTVHCSASGQCFFEHTILVHAEMYGLPMSCPNIQLVFWARRQPATPDFQCGHSCRQQWLVLV